MKIEITKQQLQVLLELLNRVQLRGNEVPAFNQILKVLNEPLKEDVSSSNKNK